MHDQYGNHVPDDLVLLDLGPAELETDENIATIDRADWYEFAHYPGDIYVSWSQVGALGNAPAFDRYLGVRPESFGIGTDDDVQVMHIDHALHRWSDKDGFYHA